ncbi:DMT family transporter [Ornithinimicrobium sp. LYQ92]|uniref:DMT family transporter n=1 Tax=Serinicoccus sp. LYQ92 TaxID=3378798 RepID=UPI003854BF22
MPTEQDGPDERHEQQHDQRHEQEPGSRRTPGPTLTPLLAAALCGAVLPVQARVNGTLSEQVSALPAATISFGTGLVLLTCLLAVPGIRARAARVPRALAQGRLRWWQVLGGVGGGALVASQTYAVPQVGVTAFLIAVIGGQAASALLVDRWGLGPGPPQPLRTTRVLAALLAVTGVAVAASAPGRAAAGEGSGLALLVPLAVVLLAGAGTSVQQAFNGVVTTVSRDPLATAWFNFVTGTLTLVVLGGAALVVGGQGPRAVDGLPWWAWTGGMMGVLFIALAAWAVQHVSVLVFALVTVSTQLLVGLLTDAADPVSRALLGPQVLLGVGLALVASVGAALSRPAQRARDLPGAGAAAAARRR